MKWYVSSILAADRLDMLALEAKPYSIQANELPESTRSFWTGEAATATAEILQRYADSVDQLLNQTTHLAAAIRQRALQLEAERQALEARREIEGGTDNE